MGLKELIIAFGNLINISLGVSMGIAVLVFFWGLGVFLFKVGNEKSHEEGRNKMIWGAIALFVLVSIWGIVTFVQRDLGIIAYPDTSHPQDMGGVCDGSEENPCY
jgi:hypothetical protein